jgi:tetratricopeptide (TPR) repeat protein
VARQPKSEHPDVIEEIEGIAERAAQWIREHLLLSIGMLVGLLAVVASLSALVAYRTSEAESAADALDRVTQDYLRAMGAEQGSLEVPELANPEAAAAIRAEYAALFDAVAAEHVGTVAGALARLEEGNLSESDGDLDASIEIWRATLQGLDSDSNLRAIFQLRIGQAYEAAERWVEAAEAYEEAARFDRFPLRYWAMADAARCFSEAGEIERGRDLALRLYSEGPSDLSLPEHQSAMLRELRQTRTP